MPKSGYITASKFEQLMKPTDIKKGEFGDGATNLAYRLAAERMGVEYDDNSFGRAIEWGIDNEPLARRTYESENFTNVIVPTFIEHPDIEFVGGTPDGLVGEDGGIEIKCPENPAYHLRNCANAYQYHNNYKAQVQGYLMISGRKWWDFVSYDPRFPAFKRLGTHRILPDQEYIDILAQRLKDFNQLIQTIINS